MRDKKETDNPGVGKGVFDFLLNLAIFFDPWTEIFLLGLEPGKDVDEVGTGHLDQVDRLHEFF